MAFSDKASNSAEPLENIFENGTDEASAKPHIHKAAIAIKIKLFLNKEVNSFLFLAP